MKLQRLNPKGLHPREVIGVAALEHALEQAAFCRGWFGFTNLMVRKSRAKGERREIDVVLVAHDQLLIVDLKDWGGRVDNRAGQWFQNGAFRGRSASTNITDNAQLVSELLKSDLKDVLPTPYVQEFVVFTDPGADLTGLSKNDLLKAFHLHEFLRLVTDKDAYELRHPPRHAHRSWNLKHPLTADVPATALRALFREGGPFEARTASFEGYETGGHVSFAHPGGVWAEYRCEHLAASETGLLRLWDCHKLPTEVSAAETRRTLLTRENKVLAYLREVDPDTATETALRWRARDESFGMSFWDVFELGRTARRLFEHLDANPGLPLDGRIQLVGLLLHKVATLHRREVAHCDIGAHSLWIEPEGLRIRLSAFGAAHYPTDGPDGERLASFVRAGRALTEDPEPGAGASAYVRDVHQLAHASWRILTGQDHPGARDADITDHGELLRPLPERLRSWLLRGMLARSADRFADAPEMERNFELAAGRAVEPGLLAALQRHRSETAPYFIWPPTTPLEGGRSERWLSAGVQEVAYVKLWPVKAGEVATSARVLDMLERAGRIKQLLPSWAPEVLGAGWGPRGVHLAVHFVEGADYEQFAARADGGAALRFAVRLVRAVAELHAAGLVHGRMAAGRVLVVERDDGPEPILVNLVDLDLGDGEAAVPGTASLDPAPPRERDALAVSKLVADLLLRTGADASGNDLAGRLVKTAASAGRGRSSLDDLVEQIDRPPPPDLPRLELVVGIVETGNQDDFLPDNGDFHVVVEPGGLVLEIVGMDQRLRLRFDPGGRPATATLNDAPPLAVDWAFRNRVAAFRGSVTMHRSDRCHETGVATLLAVPAVAAALLASRAVPLPGGPDADTAGIMGLPPGPGPAAPAPEPPAATRWREVIAAEEDAFPFVEATSALKYDEGRKHHVLECDPGPIPYEFGRRNRVQVWQDGRYLAELDTLTSRRDRLVLRNLRPRGFVRLAERLDLRDADSQASFERRQSAVGRIVARAGVLPGLIDHFDPGIDVAPVAYATTLPTDGDLGPYELNPDQREAMRHLLGTGPVGLLQGPPGTGKSRFIGALVHWVVTRGKFARVLVLSQSHEAANGVAEKIVQAAGAFGEVPDLLRVGQVGRVSPNLLAFHADPVQDRLRAKLDAGTAARIGRIGRAVGLPPGYVDERFELEVSLGHLVEALVRRRGEEPEKLEEDRAFAFRMLASLERACADSVERHAPGRALEPGTALPLLRRELAERHRVTNEDAEVRLGHAITLSSAWGRTLASRGFGIEELFTRTRSIVCGTCVGIGRPAINIAETEFDLVVIDEAARCDPGELAVGLQVARRAILVGDHRQLPPLYDHLVARLAAGRLGMEPGDGSAAVQALAVSDFQRAFGSPYGKSAGRTLRIQYRMAPDIRDLVSRCFYSDIGLRDGRGAPPAHYALLPGFLAHQVTWLDTSGPSSRAGDRKEGTSWSNAGEVAAVMAVLRTLSRQRKFWARVQAGPELREGEQAIGVIAMYAAQKRALQAAFDAGDWPAGFGELVRIDTVDAYQGKENRIVIVSLVRSFPGDHAKRRRGRGPLRHVTDFRRANVALSRAMERLVIVGSAATFGQDWPDNSLRKVVGHLEERGRVLPAPRPEDRP